MRQKLYFYFRVFFILFLLVWSIGFLVFVSCLFTYSPIKEQSFDAIVVLTGDKGRLPAGIKLLQQNQTSYLFISGVGGGAEFESLSGTESVSTNDREKIFLGRLAENTRENAEETKSYVDTKAKDIYSILLVTSYYHQPRSMIEFKKAFPDVLIQPYPVFYQVSFYKNFKILLKEYNKYLVAFIRAEILDK